MNTTFHVQTARMEAPEHSIFPCLLQAVQRLPDLVLLEIFSNVGTNTPDFDSWRWTLSHVCYKWRAVLVSFPSFWSTIYLSFQNTPSSSLLLHRLTLQLNHSQTLPLTISLSLQTSNQAQAFLKPLCAVSPRWQKLTLATDLSNLHFLQSTLNREGKGLPELRSLNLILLLHSSTSTTSIALIENAPRLTDLTITADPCGYTTKSLGIPFAQVTQLRVYDLSPEMRGILEEMPKLEVLIIQRFRSLQLDSELSLPSLHTLAIGTGSTKFLDHLDVPNLHTLRLGCSVSGNVEVARFLKRSKGTLRSLALAFATATDSLPLDLDSLYLYRPSSEVVRGVFAKTHIRELALFSASKQVENGVLADSIVGSQSRGLKKLWLYCHDTVDEEALDRIRESGVEMVQCKRWWSDFVLDV